MNTEMSTAVADTSKRGGGSPARLYALLAGAFLALFGTLGFFYDAGFGTDSSLTSDDMPLGFQVNGWRNVLDLLAGLVALYLASARPRLAAAWLGGLYTALAVWGLAVTERGVGSIADVLPLADPDNLLHLAIGVLGLLAAISGARGLSVTAGRDRYRAARRRASGPKRGG